MTQHTGRDAVWDAAVQTVMSEESFYVTDIVQTDSVDVSERTVRDTLKTMADLGWLKKQKSNKNCWCSGELINDCESVNNTKEAEGPESIDKMENKEQLESGEVYLGTVDKANSNALIWFNESGGSHINLGPIDKSSVGELIRFRYISGVWGKCLDEEYTYDGYHPHDGKSSSSRSSSNRRSKYTSGNGTITDKDPNNKNKLLTGHL